jgi:hypothetical protein
MQRRWVQADEDAGNGRSLRQSGSSQETAPGFRVPAGAPAGDLRAVLIRAGIDPLLEGEALQEAVHRAIALHRRSCTWTEVHAGWVVTLRFPERRRFFGTTLEEALTWCLAWVMGEKVRLLHPRDRNREGTDERAWHRCGLGDG